MEAKEKTKYCIDCALFAKCTKNDNKVFADGNICEDFDEYDNNKK